MKKFLVFFLIMSVWCGVSFASDSVVGLTIDFEGYTLDNERINSKEFFSANKITMINVWGSWCPPCVNELEALAKLNKKLHSKGCGIIAIEVEQDQSDSTYDKAKKLLQEKGVTYPNIVMPYDDRGGSFMSHISIVPTTFFVDSKGEILTEPIEGAAPQEYESTINKLLKKK